MARAIVKEHSVKYQTKILSANHLTDNTVPDLTFNNLEIGKTYRISGQVGIQSQNGDNAQLRAEHNGSEIGRVEYEGTATGDTDQIKMAFPSTIFTASVTILEFVAGSLTDPQSAIEGNGGFANGTFIRLEELPSHVTTTQWT